MHFKLNLSYSGQNKNSETKDVTTLLLKNGNSVLLQYALCKMAKITRSYKEQKDFINYLKFWGYQEKWQRKIRMDSQNKMTAFNPLLAYPDSKENIKCCQ